MPDLLEAVIMEAVDPAVIAPVAVATPVVAATPNLAHVSALPDLMLKPLVMSNGIYKALDDRAVVNALYKTLTSLLV
ncbi:hypothetical protein EZV62_012133 [Acer yangbiense]|uniref:Uncharacterized protein n=1 Tax=Acer yangbiense TaxID=1000413 RepID=A0A5C7HV24_9ROSI|nr:hypothetical protein EZV62_012133 [Acer yangbiense]